MTTHHTAPDATTPIFDTVVADIGLIWWPPADTHEPEAAAPATAQADGGEQATPA
ncbi:hypothetical protein [Amycolatopsis sp. FDAARGOS 1241]|uniref:hypothetical protein n=1 Tax=Amycolatopsis sp. FDAARGOS 1241 TaxID=2778070 RepID=UPI00195171F3|nr:hypothetical protein [Amycolatopsis sp. FDAARGOS 1241]QRP42977.1 hypothetical protein I6J71_26390 [Amycolatopsis sp. FDAARGOS 1241]